jgi:hypothetical protein
VAATNPGECGSRVGGVGRFERAIVCGDGGLDGPGETDCAAEAANVSKTIWDATTRKCRNVDFLLIGAGFILPIRLVRRSDEAFSVGRWLLYSGDACDR